MPIVTKRKRVKTEDANKASLEGPRAEKLNECIVCFEVFIQYFISQRNGLLWVTRD
jgi:hypothetical protein